VDEEQERYTRAVIDPLTHREYTVNVYPYSWGYKYDIRDNEQGTVIQDGGVKPSFDIAMEDGRQWFNARDKEANSKLHVGVWTTRDGQFVGGVLYPDSFTTLAATDPYPTREEARKHGEALMAVVQEQENRQGGRTRQDVDGNGKVFSWIERDVQQPHEHNGEELVR
jgi:hypothetical protein